MQQVYKCGDFGGWFVRAGESDQKAGTTHFVCSTADEDRMGDYVEQNWRTAEYKRNPVVLDNHNRERVVGRGLNFSVRKSTSGNLEGDVLWDMDKANPVGMLVGHQHLNGFRSTGSVGFVAEKTVSRLDLPDDDPRKQREISRWEAGRVFIRPKLLEFSSAPIPANANAAQRYLAERVADTGDSDEQVRRVLDETLSSRIRDELLTVARADPEFRRVVMAFALSTPNPAPIGPPPDWFTALPPE